MKFGSDLALGLAFLVLLLGVMREPPTPLPGGRVYEQLAAFSYSLYLLHYPIVLFAAAWVQSRWGVGLSQPPTRLVAFLVMGGLLVTANLYAWLVSRVTESRTATVRRFLTALFFPVASPAPAAPRRPTMEGERVFTGAQGD